MSTKESPGYAQKWAQTLSSPKSLLRMRERELGIDTSWPNAKRTETDRKTSVTNGIVAKFKIRGQDLMNAELLSRLERARWSILSQTYGSSHSTLIGLLVDWWITSGAEGSNWVLESGLPCEGQERCDAILVEDEIPRGIVEVEGSRYQSTIEKIGKYFASEDPRYSGLQFGIFLAYGYGCQCKTWEQYLDKFVKWGKENTKKLQESHPRRQLIILALNKSCEQKKLGSKKLGEYCRIPSQVRGTIIQDGEELTPTHPVVWPRQSS